MFLTAIGATAYLQARLLSSQVSDGVEESIRKWVEVAVRQQVLSQVVIRSSCMREPHQHQCAGMSKMRRSRKQCLAYAN